MKHHNILIVLSIAFCWSCSDPEEPELKISLPGKYCAVQIIPTEPNVVDLTYDHNFQTEITKDNTDEYDYLMTNFIKPINYNGATLLPCGDTGINLTGSKIDIPSQSDSCGTITLDTLTAPLFDSRSGTGLVIDDIIELYPSNSTTIITLIREDYTYGDDKFIEDRIPMEVHLIRSSNKVRFAYSSYDGTIDNVVFDRCSIEFDDLEFTNSLNNKTVTIRGSLHQVDKYLHGFLHVKDKDSDPLAAWIPIPVNLKRS